MSHFIIRILKACFTTPIITALFAATVQSQEVFTLSNLVEKVERAILPRQPYTVQVLQSVDTTASSPIKLSEGKAMAAARVSGKLNFSCAYDPKSGFRTDRTKNKSLGKTLPLSENQKTDIQIAVDFARLFKNSSQWKKIQIVLSEWNGKPSYKLTAEDGQFGYEIWVDAANYFLPRLTLKIGGRDFAELDVSYLNVNGVYWLPTRISIHHDIDGSQVIQDFSEYTF